MKQNQLVRKILSGAGTAAVCVVLAVSAFASGGPTAMHPRNDVEFAVTAVHELSLLADPGASSKVLLKMPILTEVGVIMRRNGWAYAQIRDCGAYQRPPSLELPCDNLLPEDGPSCDR